MAAFKKNYSKIAFLLIFAAIIFFVSKHFYSNRRIFAPQPDYLKTVALNDNGFIFFTSTKAQTVSDFLAENQLSLSEFDQIIPEKDSPLVSGENILIRRAVKIKFKVDGETLENHTLASTVRQAISENKIALGKLDQVVPDFNSLPTDNLTVAITRINVEEKTISEEVPFQTLEKTDAKLGWREKKVEQKGAKGIREIKYKITYKNGKEISRLVLEKKITRDPLTEIIVQGTFVKTGKSHKGLGTWYAWKGGLFAASPWLPMGSYAKVTNQANGKSVIVQINDRGPFGANRIIDLDKVAFAKIASIGAGVIDVKVEEILN
jgi:hypothetical protein